MYQYRVRVLDHARVTANVAAKCCTFGMCRKTFYKWRNIAARYAIEVLRPKSKRPPAMPNQTPTHVIEVLLMLAVTLPTLGCHQYADRLATSRSGTFSGSGEPGADSGSRSKRSWRTTVPNTKPAGSPMRSPPSRSSGCSSRLVRRTTTPASRRAARTGIMTTRTTGHHRHPILPDRTV